MITTAPAQVQFSMALPGRFGYLATVMTGSLAIFLLGYNWYDWMIGLVLLYGVWSGLRNGLMGELIWVLGTILMMVGAIKFYQPAGAWLQGVLGISRESGNLFAFVGIAIAVYVVSLAIRRVLRKRMDKAGILSASIENLGGAVAGVVRMAAVMAIVSIALCLTRSEFWHKQVGHDSRFGAYMVDKFPSVAATVNRSFPEKLWFLDTLERREDPELPAEPNATDAE